jgi:crotonobetainyl-CoA:carnitine CoA-transferase CaiB-like acyl-CoA transferase
VTKPLSGVKVLDFTRQMAGPMAAQFLSDYGADVIKFEATPTGDSSRRTGTDFVGDESMLFLMWNHGKRSLAADLRNPQGLEIAQRLGRQVDVVIENFRPGVADRIGIGYDMLSDGNPGLVYVSISAFGEGPLAPYPGTDPVVQAMSGVMSVTGEPNGSPNLVGVPIADFTAAMLGGQAALLGLLARERTGRGQKVGVSMLSGLLTSLSTRLANYWATGEDPKRFGSAHSVVAPYEAFQTSDGYAVAGVWGPNGWPEFCAAIGRPDLVEDPRFATNIDRVRNRTEITKIIADEIIQRPTSYWEHEFQSRDVLFSPVMSFSEILAHPHVVQSGIIQEVEHSSLGTIKQVGPALTLSETPASISGPPPRLGEHSEEVLREFGFAAAEIADLEKAGVVVQAL